MRLPPPPIKSPIDAGLCNQDWQRWFTQLVGENTSLPGSIDGNAATATILQTARNINGVPFDGSADITVTAAAGTLTGTTLNPTVVNSSLTSVGTLANLTVTATINGSISGNAATVTTNANLTGPITSVGNATSIASQTGTGTTFAMSAGPTFTETVNVADLTASGLITASASGISIPSSLYGIVHISGGTPYNVIQYAGGNSLYLGDIGYFEYARYTVKSAVGAAHDFKVGTQSGLIVNETLVEIPVDARLYGDTTIDVLGGTGTRMVVADASGVLSTQAISSVTGLANPSATIGLTAVNGSATTAMRSDGAPALSQAISPVWSADHVFQDHAYFGGTSTADAPAYISYVASEISYLDINCQSGGFINLTSDYVDVYAITRIHDVLSVDGLAGTGTRLVGANSSGVIDDYTTFAGSYTFSSTITASISGNAGTATALQTARNINGVSFNGSADITVTAAAGTLTGTTLNSSVVTSSLTSVGTLTALSVSGNSTLTGRVNINGATDTTAYKLNVASGYITTSGAAGSGFQAFGVGTPSAAAAGNTEYLNIQHLGSSSAIIEVGKTGTGTYRDLIISTNNAERIRMLASEAGMRISGGAERGSLYLRRANTSVASPTIVANGDQIGIIQADAYNGSSYSGTAAILFTVDGTFSSGQRPPSKIDFYTNAANAAQAIALTIDSAKLATFAGAATITGATICSSTLAVTGTSQLTGFLAIGPSTATDSQVIIRSATLATATSYGINCAPTFQVGVTTGNTAYFEVRTQASGSLTMTTGTALKIGSPTVGAGSAITNLYALDIADQTAGGTINAAIRTGLGKVLFGDTVTITGAFGCNGQSARTSAASGGALAAYAAGANGLSTGANMAALHALVVAMRAALVNNGIMS